MIHSNDAFVLNRRREKSHYLNRASELYRKVRGINPSLRRQCEDILDLERINKQLTGYDL